MRGGNRRKEWLAKTHCDYCEQKLPPDFHKLRDGRKGRRVSAALKAAKARGERIGRPSEYSRDEAVEAYAKAGSLRKAAKLLGCSPSVIMRHVKAWRNNNARQ